MSMSKKSEILVVLSGVFILLTFAFYNRYPFVYSDSGTYIRSGFEGYVPVDRPIMYGLFVRHISMKYSLWLVVLAQNIILSYVLFSTLKFVIKENYRIWFVLIIFLLTFTTGLASFSNQIMADIFMGILILSLFILLFVKKLPPWDMVFFTVLIIFSEACHFSHLFVASALMVIILLTRMLPFAMLKEISVKRIVAVSCVVFSVWLIVPTVNYFHSSKFFLSEGSHVFLMAHLNETGVLKRYLDDHCDQYPELSLCDLNEDLQVDVGTFTWVDSYSSKYGGFKGSKKEFDFILNEIISDPAYWWDNVFNFVLYGLTQLTENSVGEGLTAHDKGSSPYYSIYTHMNREAFDMLNSKQNKYGKAVLNFDFLTRIQWIVILTALFVVIFIVVTGNYRYYDQTSINFLGFILICIVLNAFFTGGLIAPNDRYSSRLIWLLPLSVAVICINNWKHLKTGIKFGQNEF